MTKVYIAGPMSGLPQFNYPAFDAAAAAIRALGHVAMSPAEMDDEHIREAALASETGDFREFDEYNRRAGTEPETWGDFLSRDVKLIADEIDAVALLPGWKDSRGARLEVFVALSVQKPVYGLNSGVLYEMDPRFLMEAITANILDQGDVKRYG